MLRYALTLTAMLGALPAIAQEALRPQEQLRLDRFETVAGNALLQAFQSGSAEDRAALGLALSGTPQVAFDEGLAGDWSCRTIKLGGMPALVVYSPFKMPPDISGQRLYVRKAQRVAAHDGLHHVA